MADLTIRTEFREGNTTVKLLNEEAIFVCSPLTIGQIKTYLQNNRPVIWNFIKDYTTELDVQTCSRDNSRNHYTIMLDRP